MSGNVQKIVNCKSTALPKCNFSLGQGMKMTSNEMMISLVKTKILISDCFFEFGITKVNEKV